MSASIHWNGLHELIEELRELPAAFATEAQGIVTGHAEAAERTIESSYPERTGHLKDGLRIQVDNVGRFGVSVLVINRAPHAYLFEVGTQARHTAIGANRGSMPAGHVFIPTTMHERHAMYEDLKDMLRRAGLTVTGDV